MSAILEKVTSFITRGSGDNTELLLFRHPFAGIQIPAGTVEYEEPHRQAALREAMEESGLNDLEIVRYIGCMDTTIEDRDLFVLRNTKVYSRPDTTSFDWAEFKRGRQVEQQREQDGFKQVTYIEHDKWPDPTYATYVITGWVPSDVLTNRARRYFYHLNFNGTSVEKWTVFIDNHLFEPFWAPFINLPEIVYPQSEWLPYVTDTLGYRFI